MSLNVGLFAAILAINIPGFRIGRWIAHMGTAVMVLVIALLAILLFVHPHSSAASVHMSPQPPFSLAFPALTFISLNLFSKLTFNGLTGLEQVAVFAGETRDAARSILRSAWVAAPAHRRDVHPDERLDADLHGRRKDRSDGADSTGARRRVCRRICSTAVSTGDCCWAASPSSPWRSAWWPRTPSSSPRPAGCRWSPRGIICSPAWFTRLHPRFRTPTRSLTVIVLLALVFSFLASAGTGTQEAFQLLTTANTLCYGVYYLLMFAVPLVAGMRSSPRPRPSARGGCFASPV